MEVFRVDSALPLTNELQKKKVYMHGLGFKAWSIS